jgi:hypothetical protein
MRQTNRRQAVRIYFRQDSDARAGASSSQFSESRAAAHIRRFQSYHPFGIIVMLLCRASSSANG